MIVKQEILFSREECNKIIDLPKENNQSWVGIDRKYSSFSINISEKTSWIFDKLKNFFEDNSRIKISSIKKQIHYHEFIEGDFFSIHDDSRDNRIYSVGVLLNDDFDGGDFNLYNPNKITLEKKQGNTYIFDVRIKHEITRVISGKRKSMIWFLQIGSFQKRIEKII